MQRSKKFQQYKLEKKLGSGGFGTVWLATKGGKKVALKEIQCESFDAANTALNEIMVAKNLVHQNLLVYRDTFLDMEDDILRVYLEMDYIEGGDMKQLLKSVEMKESDFLHYALQLVDGITFMHQNRALHRDLKPDNLLVDHSKKKLMITDFGCSVLKDSNSMNKTQVGTLYYAALELMKGVGYNNSVDIYSFGAILIYFACRDESKPIYQELLDNESSFQKKTRDRLKGLGFSEFYIALALDCLQGDPKQRPNANDIKKRLETYLNITRSVEDISADDIILLALKDMAKNQNISEYKDKDRTELIIALKDLAILMGSAEKLQSKSQQGSNSNIITVTKHVTITGHTLGFFYFSNYVKVLVLTVDPIPDKLLGCYIRTDQDGTQQSFFVNMGCESYMGFATKKTTKLTFGLSGHYPSDVTTLKVTVQITLV